MLPNPKANGRFTTEPAESAEKKERVSEGETAGIGNWARGIGFKFHDLLHDASALRREATMFNSRGLLGGDHPPPM